ncbi:MAG: soluble lytic murein transglycosylase [Candidatus Azotimanducaceae bacterium]|jgi:soluble lytic murein transglycosylase
MLLHSLHLKVSIFLLACLTASFTNNVHAGTGYAGTEFKPIESKLASNFEQRKIYNQLIYLIKSNQRTKYKQTLAKVDEKIRDYPLYPYIEYTEKVHRISRQSEPQIQAFTAQYQDTPLANQLRQRWLRNLAKHNKWTTYLKHYQPQDGNAKNLCSMAYALYKTGKVDEAFSLANDLWLVDYSQPDACDSIFKVWREAGNLSSNMAWQRFTLALDANKASLATYLVRFLHKDDKALANTALLVHKRPRTIKQHRKFAKQNKKMKGVILHGLKRLARKDAISALDQLEKYKSTQTFDENSLRETYLYIGIRIASLPEADSHLFRFPSDILNDQLIIEKQLLSALRQLKWDIALSHINRLKIEDQSAERWQYWKARILVQSELVDIREAGIRIYQSLSKERSFYGFLAADFLKKKYRYNNHTVNVAQEEILALEETPGIQRALELFILGEKTQARREWRFTTKDFSAKEHHIAAYLAQKWGWYKQSIQSTISARNRNDLNIRFPFAYTHNFISGARASDIPLSWSLGIARQESAFMPDARSGAGALGIMQVMPSTAKYVLREKKAPSNTQLTNPETNIQIGSSYLGQLLRQFDYSRVLASAAYNAGPTRARRWRDDKLPLDVWIETIPFKETRSYVINVLMFSSIYQHKLNNQALLFSPQELDLSGQMSLIDPLVSRPNP